MHRTSVLLTILTLASVLFGNCLLKDIRNVQSISTRDKRNICSRNTPCKYVICLRRIRNETSCSFVPLLFDSNCVCPPEQICSINTDMSELIPPFVYRYHCRSP
ncbi:uncharacterized protein LOC132716647 [Ruditapes philippinarum]|uniref:uncharacterized protein LOC132716647 n=1 Tax=Ruditapes philippinarum TaxID=129788 RepID=UPI00295B46D4|nr:uncharacterized protein LOC132716647 [Ruditapes philippinarum]